MPTDASFRRCTYLMLGIACAALGYAEWEFLPEVSVLAGGVIVTLVLLARAGGRYELDLQAANRVGVVIAVAAAGWLAYLFASPNSLINTFPWPASLLPCLGAVLLVLIPAKLSRPKHVGDWWAMQAIGLVTVGLACAMAEGGLFGVLLGLYFVSFVASLTLFYYRRSAGTLPASPGTDAGPMALVVGAPDRWSSRWLAGRAAVWLGAAVVVALPVFFATPRSDAPPFQFGRVARETGLGADQLVDLNRTGELRVNREVAYEVRVLGPDGRPKDDLPSDQRWRAVGYLNYEDGRWSRSTLLGRLIARMAAPTRPSPVWLPPQPRLGPNQSRLTFSPRVRSAEPVLLDPVDWRVGEPVPVWSEVNDQARPWWQSPDGSFQPNLGTNRGDETPEHVQFARTPVGTADDPDLGPPFQLDAPVGDITPLVLVSTFTAVKSPRVKDFAVDLLNRLAAADTDLKDAIGRSDDRRGTLRVAPEDFERVSRAVNQYFASSGEYTYTLNARRVDRKMDPVDDFLLNTKAGHCERFAAALTLVLRSLGVPAVYVLGYKGCEAEGNGLYLIRQEHAHAWVEVMVRRRPPPGFPADPALPPPAEVWHWLSLDPSSGSDAAPVAATGDWFHNFQAASAAFFADFIVGYNPERRQQAVAATESWLRRWWWAVLSVVAILAVGAGVLAITRPRRGRPARGTTDSGVPWFDQMTRALAAHGLGPAPGATRRETAEAAEAALRGSPSTAAVADIPVAVTRAFYLARYANRPPAADEVTALYEAVGRLRARLRAVGLSPRKSPH